MSERIEEDKRGFPLLNEKQREGIIRRNLKRIKIESKEDKKRKEREREINKESDNLEDASPGKYLHRGAITEVTRGLSDSVPSAPLTFPLPYPQGLGGKFLFFFISCLLQMWHTERRRWWRGGGGGGTRRGVSCDRGMREARRRRGGGKKREVEDWWKETEGRE